VNTEKVASVSVAKVALATKGGKAACEVAIAREAPTEISMGQVQNDKGFCAQSGDGVIAYVELLNLVAENDDHTVQFRVTTYR